MNKFTKRTKRTIIIFMGSIMIYMVVCQLTVFSVDHLFQELFITKENDERISQLVYDKFSGVRKVYEKDNYNVDLKLKRIIAVHIFGNGYVWYLYSIDIQANNKPYAASSDIINRVQIRLIDGKWNIIDSLEKP